MRGSSRESMISTLEITVPAAVPLGPAFKALPHQAVQLGPSREGFRPVCRRSIVGPFKSYGVDGTIHLSAVDRREPTHKLQLQQVERLRFSEVLDLVRKVFECDVGQLRVTRIALAADLPGVAVSYFKKAAYASQKQSVVSTTGIDCPGFHLAEDLVLGSPPDQLRVYDHGAECRHEYKRLLAEFGRRASALPFERIFGFFQDTQLTRVERLIETAAVPPCLGSVAALRENILSFDPFYYLNLREVGSVLPSPAELGLGFWLQAAKLREMYSGMGMSELRKWLSRYSSGNTARIFRRFAPYFAFESDRLITKEDLRESYRGSIRRQFAG
jgi:hypothetical protein